jgi:hypothetical protein
VTTHTGLPQPHAWPAAVLWYELDAGGLEGGPDRRQRSGVWGSGAALEVDKGPVGNLCRHSQLPLIQVQHGAGSAALSRRNRHFWGNLASDTLTMGNSAITLHH